MNLKEAPMSTILNNSKSCCFRLLLLVFSSGVLLALTWHTWLNYPVDKQLIIDIPVVVLAILGLFFAINSGLKKSGKFDTDS